MFNRWVGWVVAVALGAGCGDGAASDGAGTTGASTTTTTTAAGGAGQGGGTTAAGGANQGGGGAGQGGGTAAGGGGAGQGGGTAAGGGGAGQGGGGGGGPVSGTISWKADGAAITTATFNPGSDPVTLPAAGMSGLGIVAATADFQEQMSIVLVFTKGESIPAGTYTCGALPNDNDSVLITLAHLGVVAQAKDDILGVSGACTITLDGDAVPGGHVTGSFTVAAPRQGAVGPDIVITDGVFDVTDH